ncbi:hypothetical protein AAY42_10055 [Flagellimonas eckloniae]|uniref:Uncharacterized protein n=2 Tax=Flagellimonas eckloniae TaxID=346185 RepID=A0A0Q0XMC7_9FLAO|nr:hypothetical protein AAY42_10055 [Allomuricauda eckloniae]
MLIFNTKMVVSQFEGMVQSAIQQETTKIENSFETRINKLKTRDGGTIDFSVEPRIDNKAQTNVTKDSVPEKRGFFKRLFGNKQ